MTELTGKLNGVDIVFIAHGGGVYTTVVPKQVTGIYILELKVTKGDWADSYSNMFVRIDFDRLNARFLDPRFKWAEGDQKNYGYRELEETLKTSEVSCITCCECIHSYTINEISCRGC